MRKLAEGYIRAVTRMGERPVVLAERSGSWWYAEQAPADCFAPECPFVEGQWIQSRAAPNVYRRWKTQAGYLESKMRVEDWQPCAPPRSAWPCLYPGDRVELVENPCGPEGVPNRGLLDEIIFKGTDTVKGLGTWVMGTSPLPIVIVGGRGAYIWPWNLRLVEGKP